MQDSTIYELVRPQIEGELVFDIGAGSGQITQIFKSFGCQVVAVEPQVEQLESPLFEGATVVNAVVSNEVGRIKFYHNRHSPHGSTCSNRWQDIAKVAPKKRPKIWEVRRLPAITLDQLISDYGKPKYIKVDVEGFEDRVFGGLSQKVDLVSFEYTGGFADVFANCLQRLGYLGFRNAVAFEKRRSKQRDGSKVTTYYRRNFEKFDDIIGYHRRLKWLTQGDILMF